MSAAQATQLQLREQLSHVELSLDRLRQCYTLLSASAVQPRLVRLLANIDRYAGLFVRLLEGGGSSGTSSPSAREISRTATASRIIKSSFWRRTRAQPLGR